MLRFIAFTAFCAVAAYAEVPQPVIDNSQVTVWDVTWTKGQISPVHDRDVVVLWTQAGKTRGGSHKTGQASYGPFNDEGVAEANAPRSLIVALKDFRVPPIENKTGYPLAFPRPHVKKLLENDRVIVWSYRWNPGEPTPMHFHDKDVVVVYLEDTALTSTTPDGAKKLNEYKAFDVRFNKGNRTHFELLDHGAGSAMMVELK
jgi:hypothetical protein